MLHDDLSPKVLRISWEHFDTSVLKKPLVALKRVGDMSSDQGNT